MKKNRIYLTLTLLVPVISIIVNIFLIATLHRVHQDYISQEEKLVTAQNTISEIDGYIKSLFSEMYTELNPQTSAIDILKYMMEIEDQQSDGYIFFEVGIDKNLQARFINEVTKEINIELYDFVSEEQAFKVYLSAQSPDSVIAKVLNQQQDKKLQSSYSFKLVPNNLGENQKVIEEFKELITKFQSQNNLSPESITLQERI